MTTSPAALRFLDWIDRSFPAVKKTLAPPAPADELAKATRALGHGLPPALEQLWRAHDGQQGESAGYRLFDDFAWLSVAEALESREMMTRVLEETAQEYGGDERWASHWLPFAQDIGGGMLVVDVGTGEVFEYQSDGDGRSGTLASSFDAFIDGYLARFDSGERVVDPERGIFDPNPPPQPAPGELVPSRRTTVLLFGGIALYVVAFVAFVLWLERGR